jgi:hypothetical protein
MQVERGKVKREEEEGVDRAGVILRNYESRCNGDLERGYWGFRGLQHGSS